MDPLLLGALTRLVGKGAEKIIATGFHLTTTQDAELIAARRAVFEQAQKRMRTEGLVNKFLRLYYPEDDLAQHGLCWYICRTPRTSTETHMVTAKNWLRLNCPTSGSGIRYQLIQEAPEPVLVKEDLNWVIRIIEEMQISMHDAPLFRLIDFARRRGGFKVSFALTTYLRFFCTQVVLEHELVQAFIDRDFSPARVFQDRKNLLPSREKFLPNVKSLIDFRNRVCAGGVDSLLAFRRPHPEDDFVFLAKKTVAQSRSGAWNHVFATHGLSPANE